MSKIGDLSVTESGSYIRLQAMLEGLSDVPPLDTMKSEEDLENRAIMIQRVFQHVRSLQISHAGHRRITERPSS